MYTLTFEATCSRDMALRLLMKSFRSGWVNRYADVDASTPARTPSRSAALQFGGLAAGSSLACASGLAPRSAAPKAAPARIDVVSFMADSLRSAWAQPLAPQATPQESRAILTAHESPDRLAACSS